jgi:hypothetical protein
MKVINTLLSQITNLKRLKYFIATFRDEPNDQDQDQADFVEDDQVIDSLLHRSRKESMAVIDTVDSLIRDHLAGFAAAGINKTK